MPFASTSRLPYKPHMQPVSPQCFDCVVPPPVECAEPSCSTSVLTDQCTDQCVVIACSDPDHPQSICDRDDSHRHCDLVCDQTVGCTDCHGFDAFLKCCDEYQSYHAAIQRPQQQNSSSQPFSSWDSSFNDSFWQCESCEGHEHGTKTATLDRPVESVLNQYLPVSTAAQEYTDKVLYPSHQDSFQMSSYSAALPPVTTVAPERSAPTHSCMWANCHEIFSSLEELVGHVNLHHLVSSPLSTRQDDRDVAQDHILNPTKAQACLWADCNTPHPSCLANCDMLAYHLMREHLGITPPSEGRLHSCSFTNLEIPQGTSSTPPTRNLSALAADPPESSSRRSSSPTSIPNCLREESHHSCQGAHECRWKDCGLSFHSCDDLTTHITSVHIGGGKAHYECFWEQCTRNGTQGFQSKQKICRHVQSHTGHRPFQCTICNQNFSEAATLQQHIRRHTQEKPYVCDFPGCGKSFAITGALTIHKRTHNGDKPFKCIYCDRGFAESSNLSKHLRTHTGARPYICHEPGCNKSFARPDQLNRHKGVHKKQLRGVGGSSED